MNYQQTTGVTIREAFERFHRDNPVVFVLIVKAAKKKFNQGSKKFSVKQIVNSLRWHKFIETKETNLFEVEGTVRKFRIGDQYISHYARMLIEKYPHMEGHIEMRTLRAK